jgi:hypothetical protein
MGKESRDVRFYFLCRARADALIKYRFANEVVYVISKK